MSPDKHKYIANLVSRLRSRAYEDRHHRKYREEAAVMLLALEKHILDMQASYAKAYERGTAAERCFPTREAWAQMFPGERA